MFRKLIVLASISVLALLALSPSSAAQTTNPCFSSSIWYFPDPLPLGWWILGPGQGPYSYTIATFNTGCYPPSKILQAVVVGDPLRGHHLDLLRAHLQLLHQRLLHVRQVELHIFLSNGDTCIEAKDVFASWLGRWSRPKEDMEQFVASLRAGFFGGNLWVRIGVRLMRKEFLWAAIIT